MHTYMSTLIYRYLLNADFDVINSENGPQWPAVRRVGRNYIKIRDMDVHVYFKKLL